MARVTQSQPELQVQVSKPQEEAVSMEGMPVRQQTYLDALLGQINVGYVIADQLGRIIYSNKHFCDMLGYTLQEIKHLPFSTFIYSDDYEKSVALYSQLFIGELNHYHLEKRYIRKDGRIIWVRASVSCYDNGRLPGQMTMTLIEDITSQKRSERRLQDEKQLFETMLECVPGIFCLFDQVGKFKLWNKGLETITGYSRQELTQMRLYDVFHAEHQKFVEHEVGKAFDSGKMHIELPLLNKYGDETPYVFTGSRGIFDGENVLLGSGIDISANGATGETLKQDEGDAHMFMEQLKILHEVTQTLSRTTSFDELTHEAVRLGHEKLGIDRFGLWFFDEDLTTVQGSYGIDEQGDIRDERHIYTPLNEEDLHYILYNEMDLQFSSHVPLFNERHQEVGTGWHIVAPILDGDKKLGLLNCDNLLTQMPTTPFLLEIIRMYSATLGSLLAQKKDREALQQSEESWRSLVQNAPNIILLVDRDYRVQFSNRPIKIDQSEVIIGTNVLDLVIPEHRTVVETALSEALQTGTPTLYEASVSSSYGQPAPYITRVGPVKHEGEVTSLVLIAQDVSEIRLMERQKLDIEMERQKTQVLTNFITNASHEFRTPLSIINSSVYMLQHIEEPERRQSYYDQITYQVTNITALIENLTTMSRLDSGAGFTFSEVDVNTIAKSVATNVRTMLKERNITLSLSLDETGPVVFGTGAELYRAVANILTNAIQHSPEETSIEINTYLNDETVTIEVSDQGAGIDSYDLPRIFERFYRGDSAHSTRGFGLGLPIAQRIIEVHFGNIEVETQPGLGSCFRIHLPTSH